MIDFVGFGATASCAEGSATGATYAPAPSATTADVRVQNGCGDVNINNSDFATAAPAPRNSATATAACACVAQNELGTTPAEIQYCDVQFPPSLSVATGASTGNVYGRIYQAGVTEAAGANASVRAQLGYGSPSVNPEYQSGWTWTNASYNATFVDPSNDEYQASFTAPAVGSYRYVYRFSLDQGVSWTYCDANTGDFGAGYNPGLTFDFATEPVLTVTP